MIGAAVNPAMPEYRGSSGGGRTAPLRISFPGARAEAILVMTGRARVQAGLVKPEFLVEIAATAVIHG